MWFSPVLVYTSWVWDFYVKHAQITLKSPKVYPSENTRYGCKLLKPFFGGLFSIDTILVNFQNFPERLLGKTPAARFLITEAEVKICLGDQLVFRITFGQFPVVLDRPGAVIHLVITKGQSGQGLRRPLKIRKAFADLQKDRLSRFQLVMIKIIDGAAQIFVQV